MNRTFIGLIEPDEQNFHCSGVTIVLIELEEQNFHWSDRTRGTELSLVWCDYCPDRTR